MKARCNRLAHYSLVLWPKAHITYNSRPRSLAPQGRMSPSEIQERTSEETSQKRRGEIDHLR